MSGRFPSAIVTATGTRPFTSASVECPVAIQNAPEFLGIGLSSADLLALNAAHPNVSVVKAESSALGVATTIEALGGRMKVFNGRGGLELLDNLRAGVDGMIPGSETIDLQVGVEQAMRAGNEARAEELYARLLPVIAFAMQGLANFVLYGKLIAAHRLGLAPSHDRIPADTPTPGGLAWAKRFAAELGPLPA
jgi:4-hydroxy-tetrahydrodipicolinate synthase